MKIIYININKTLVNYGEFFLINKTFKKLKFKRMKKFRKC